MNQTPKTLIWWMQIEAEPGALFLAATPSGLCFVGSAGAAFEELERWSNRTFRGGSVLTRDDEAMAPYARQLIAYLKGELNAFSVAFDLTGTPFQQAVWQALQEIPYGKTWSYSDIAERIGRPSSVRAVGTAIGANPVLIGIPCHRVIGKNGALTGYRGGLPMKRHLLELERGTRSKQEVLGRV